MEESDWIEQLRLPELLPQTEEEWLYLVACAAFFTICGLACGYFVWRKGHMQTLDAEMEVMRTENDLRTLREDLGEEERQVRGGEDAELVEEVLEEVRLDKAGDPGEAGEAS